MAEKPAISRKTQQIGGAIIALPSLIGTLWTWYTAFFQDYFYQYASMIFPPFFLVGLALIFFPDYKTERISRGEDISDMEGMSLITPRWWAVLIFSLLAGFGNYIFLYFS